MATVRGRYVPLSLPRRMVSDTLYAGSFLKLVTGESELDIGRLLSVRAATAAPRPSLLAMCVKAFAIVAARRPDLRRVFVARPWHRLFEYDHNVVSVVVGREYEGETALLLVKLERPETMPLLEIDAHLRKPASENKVDRSLALAKMPLVLRRLFWSLAMNWMPRLRGKVLGTMGFSVTAAGRGAALTLLTPWTTTVCYTAPDESGRFKLRITLDHRVYDGMFASKVMDEVRRELLGPICAELAALPRAAKLAA